jgi:hypothetical protein
VVQAPALLHLPRLKSELSQLIEPDDHLLRKRLCIQANVTFVSMPSHASSAPGKMCRGVTDATK